MKGVDDNGGSNMGINPAPSSSSPSSSVQINYDENEPIFRTSFLKKIFTITPLIELCGYMKDHRMLYKEHWIDSCKTQPERLKATLSAQYENELVLAVLYLSVIFGTVTSSMAEDDSYANDFSEGRSTLAGWCTFLGIISVITGLTFVITCYMTITI